MREAERREQAAIEYAKKVKKKMQNLNLIIKDTMMAIFDE